MKKLLFLSVVALAIPAPAAVVVNATREIIPGYVPAPLTVGGYAIVKSQKKCCTIFQIHDVVYSGPNNPIWIVTFHADTSGDWPVNDTYWQSARTNFNNSDLQGLSAG